MGGGRAWSDAAIGQETPRAGRGEERPPAAPRGFGESEALLTLPFWTSDLQNGERINFGFFKPPNLRQFMTSVPRNCPQPLLRRSA